MDLNLWCIIASALLVTAHAITFDRGPQLFVDPASQTLSNEQKYETKEVVLYLTPSQVKVLEAGGAVVRPRTNEAQPGFRVDIPTQNEEETQQTIEQEQTIPDIQNTDEQEQKQIKELEEIFKILNEQIEEEQRREQTGNDDVRPVVEEQDDLPEVVQEEQQEAEQANAEEEEQVPEEEQQEEEQEEEEEDQEEEGQDEAQEEGQEEDEEEQTEEQQEERQEEQQEEQDEDEEEGSETQGDDEEEEVVEIPRRVPSRFRPTTKQPEVKYPTLSPDKKEKRTRTQPIGEAKKSKLRPRQKNSKKADKKKSKAKKDANRSEKKSKTNGERQVQTTNVGKAQEKLTALLTPLLSSDKIVQSITQQRGKLVQSELELQAALRKLKQAPKYNDQKFAIEVEKLKENLEKQNALSRAEVIAKTTPTLIKEDLKKQRPGQAVNRPAAYNAAYTLKASQPYTVPLHYVRPVSVPIVKSAKLEVQKPVTVEVEERVPVHVAKNVYYKLNKPYVVERIVPVGKKEVATSLPIRKPERLTILRHVWEH